MKEDQYKYLLDKTRAQVEKEMGQEFNFYQSDVWTYLLEVKWICRKKILIVEFKNNKAVKIKIKKVYGKKIPISL
ncbi:hypothetical protein M2347_000643 [Chryseobacterium sp. H1D6B]|uniref:hypothetical protein n=1 Tax=Chryseobacterium sp. H1D6B TaxID=2940588 RepID=UPI0017B6272E|nr:hypothetical protein [Chryseobacterium sp. H1D6B]MDH6250916.1 hypothetical protein [Chryseobacterium sp. H1D6B]